MSLGAPTTTIGFLIMLAASLPFFADSIVNFG
jgi:hypothetical protein